MGLGQAVRDLLYWSIYRQFLVREKPSPRNRVGDGDYFVDAAGLHVNLKAHPKEVWITPVADTNSMDPWFDETDRVVLKRSDGTDVEVGDVVIYAKNGDNSDLIIHQVVARDRDAEGPFFVAKGLNNVLPDPFRVRPAWVRWVLVAVLY